MTLTPVQRQEWLGKILTTARAASEVVTRIYGEPDVGTEYKKYGDPVTRADKEANALIVGGLGVDFPGVPVVAEESDPAAYADFASSPIVFFVDPLDGTREFIARNGEFCVMIGVAEEGRPTIGVIVCPSFGRGAYVAAEGVGAYFIAHDDMRKPLQIEGSVDSLSRARCAISRLQRSRSLDSKLASLGCKELLPIGSSGIKAVQVAVGHVEIYAHPSRAQVKLWDTCAPEAIVRAAGGVLTDSKGRAFDYRGALAQGAGVVAASARLHAQVVRQFSEYDQRTGGETLG